MPNTDPVNSSSDFQNLQSRLEAIWRSLESERPEPHTSIVVPALSFDPQELAKIQGVSFYEERLLFSLIRLRDPRATLVYITSQPVHPEIVDYYLGLLRGVSGHSARSRLHLLCLYDSSPISLTQKILDRPRLIRRITELVRDPSRAYLTCFNSSDLERRLALEIGIPLNGADPEVLWTGTKSGSRRVFDEAGIAQTPGFGGIRTEEEVLDALTELKRGDPGLSRAVVKLDESFAGAGNAIYNYPQGPSPGRSDLRRALDDLVLATNETAESYLNKFETMGGIVEAFVEAGELRSPSTQVRIQPDGSLALISTHDQVLGGAAGQTYLGCRFPADDGYRAQIQEAALRVGSVLQSYGVVSRFGVDFLVHPTGDGGWRCLAVEINLRMGGTTPPFMALQFLTGGRLDPETGLYTSARGVRKYYYSTDNLRSASYHGLLPEDFSDIRAAYGLDFNAYRETGAVFHMIGSLSQFGKIGVTCIGDSAEESMDIYRRVVAALDREGHGAEAPAEGALHPFEVAAQGME